MSRSGPEKLVTEPLILAWGIANGFDFTWVDTSAVYSKGARGYRMNHASEPLPDLIGNKGSLSVWIELKAPKKRYDLSDDQRAFLIRKIEQGCFACVTDCPNHLNRLWIKYLNSEDKLTTLLNDIPEKKKLIYSISNN